MGLILNIQLSAFCDCRIEPSAENISNLMNEINKLGKIEFLPNIISTQNVDLASGKIDVISNLSFVTSDQSNQIICRNERIDCLLNLAANEDSKFENNIEFAKKVVVLIMKSYSVQSNRLALNVNLLGNQIQKMKFDKNIIPALDLYNGKDIKEWSLRNNMSFPIKISEKDENVNVITELGIAVNKVSDEKRMLCHIDINTMPENTGYRFSYENFESFIKETQKIVLTIKSNFEERYSDDRQ